MIKLSQTSKMPAKSWSIPAGGKFCPGSKDAEVCKGCYAMKGFYNMPTVKSPRLHNSEDWKRDGWVDDMVALLSDDPLFRWFDSGDVYHPKLIDKINAVVSRTKNTKHWIPTKMWTVKGTKKHLNNLSRHGNCVVRKSAKDINQVIDTAHNSAVFTKDVFYSKKYPDVFRCKAPDQDHKCKDCRACWDKSVKTVAYLKH